MVGAGDVPFWQMLTRCGCGLRYKCCTGRSSKSLRLNPGSGHTDLVQRTKGPADQRTRGQGGPKDQGTQGPEDLVRISSLLMRFFFYIDLVLFPLLILMPTFCPTRNPPSTCVQRRKNPFQVRFENRSLTRPCRRPSLQRGWNRFQNQ